MYVRGERTQSSASLWREMDSAQRGPPRGCDASISLAVSANKRVNDAAELGPLQGPLCRNATFKVLKCRLQFISERQNFVAQERRVGAEQLPRLVKADTGACTCNRDPGSGLKVVHNALSSILKHGCYLEIVEICASEKSPGLPCLECEEPLFCRP
ncbi:hypothetical protein EK21DRAFT_90209 [Setomelanomma holmii]|uniref:Uncharacterized protein n=1 Tax=Setomelanomma holmii TaxID=210430 RepID=A0A9P4LJB1_9PLEO|nr:hypothetical protein EK21DRAFT_90209 [Setomelanomma holmii]